MSTLRDEYAREFADARTGGDVFMGGQHRPTPSEYNRADRLIALLREKLTSKEAVEAAARGAWNHNTTEWTWERARADGSGFLAERMRTNIEAARPAIAAALNAVLGEGSGE